MKKRNIADAVSFGLRLGNKFLFRPRCNMREAWQKVTCAAEWDRELVLFNI